MELPCTPKYNNGTAYNIITIIYSPVALVKRLTVVTPNEIGNLHERARSSSVVVDETHKTLNVFNNNTVLRVPIGYTYHINVQTTTYE